MERISRRRALVLLIVFGLILMFYAGKLFSLQLAQSKQNTTNANTFTSKTIVKAARGDILDRNGNVLVGNRASYNLVFNHYVNVSPASVTRSPAFINFSISVVLLFTVISFVCVIVGAVVSFTVTTDLAFVVFPFESVAE